MLIKINAILILLILLISCQAVMAAKKNKTIDNQLIVGTLLGPDTYFTSPQGESGFDYELAKEFATFLKRTLVMKVYNNISELYKALDNNEVDIIAAGITDTPYRRSRFRLGPILYTVNQILVYQKGNPPPNNFSLISGKITVMKNSSFVDTLNHLKKHYPNLTWHEKPNADPEELLSMLHDKKIEYTIVDSSSFEINRRFLPTLRAGKILKHNQSIVWLLPLKNSNKLMSALLQFWNQEHINNTFDFLKEKYFAHIKSFDYVDTLAFIRATKNTLPKYQSLFKRYSGNLDWKKLAAMSYQESHWDPKAKSNTGVRGMMMLTLPTTKLVGVTDRLDTKQSIKGGIKYLQLLLKRLPKSIDSRQRVWFAMAAYNLGFGHIQDARKIATKMQLNPDSWSDVKKILPLLQQPKYYTKTRYGYAKGSEAVHYVDNIRRYYDTLVWIENTKISNAKSRH